MAFTSITEMYASDGVTIIDSGGTLLLSESSSPWDDYILELRVSAEDQTSVWDVTGQSWTRGNSTTLRSDLDPSEDDGFYLSHIQDVRDWISAIEQIIYPGQPGMWTSWTDDPLTTSEDPRRALYITELQDALTNIENLMPVQAEDVSVEFNSGEVGY